MAHAAGLPVGAPWPRDGPGGGQPNRGLVRQV